jgi:Fic family protein
MSIKPDIGPDRGEAVSMMEPLLLGENTRRRTELTDLALELAQKASGLRRSLPPFIVPALASLVRSMTCYYSNLIEGHDTHPVEIERALKGDYSGDSRKRVLQREATAHIRVQEWIDSGEMEISPVSINGIREIHRRFCDQLPPDLLSIEDPHTHETVPVIPGELRTRDVQVGRHIAVSPGAVPRFLGRFEAAFSNLGKTDTILAAATAHHRLLWIHPFLDGNGRVARLMSHAILRNSLETGSIWSVARGLARNEKSYKEHLSNCDLPRRNDLDGRGNLSEEALTDFAVFFLKVCIDQVDFMESLVQPQRLLERIREWAIREIRRERLPRHSETFLEILFIKGELQRGEISRLLSLGDRQARRVVSSLVEVGAVSTRSSRAPLFPAFPATLAPHWMPGLFPDQAPA